MSRRLSREELQAESSNKWRLLQQERKRIEDVRGAIERVYERHFPHPVISDIWELQLGNEPSTTSRFLICQECSVEWPCRTWHDCRDIYAATYGHEDPSPTYLTPVMRRAPEPAEPE